MKTSIATVSISGTLREKLAAIAELRRCVGTDFDGPSVEALIAALPRLVAQSEPLDPMVFQWAQRARSA